MKHKTVHGVDGRVWEITTHVERAFRADEGFEHDVTSTGAAVAIPGILAALWVAVFIWKPEGVIVPWFFWILAGLILLFFPTRWWRRRPIGMVAETEGDYDHGAPAERWAGHVRGGSSAREEMRILVRRLRTQGTPGHTDSPLHPVSVGDASNPPTVEMPIEEDR